MVKLILSIAVLIIVFYAGFTVGQLTNDVKVETRGGETVIEIDLTELSDTQRSGIRAFGIEGDTYIVTSETVACVEERVGSERFSEIVDGDMPTFGETLLMIRCY